MRAFAIFDFDDTLLRGQSLDLFRSYVLAQDGMELRRSVAKLFTLLSRIVAWHPRLRQSVKMLVLRGLRKDLLSDISIRFATDILLPRLHSKVVDAMTSHIAASRHIVILSAGLDLYLIPLFDHYSDLSTVSSKVSWSGDRFVGIGEFCYGERKLSILQQTFGEGEIDWKNSYMYSDHESDLPLLEQVGHPVVVTKTTRPTWCRDIWTLIQV